jgi:DNA invertase Pin-like site-specific DNA recombinase
MLEMLREGDTVVVYKLDRLGRSLRELVNLIAQFEERKIAFVSLKDAIDTSTAQGRFFLNIFASLAEFERDIIRERTRTVSCQSERTHGWEKERIKPGSH